MNGNRADRISGRHAAPLDGIRGIAALLVVFHHCAQFIAPSSPALRLIQSCLDFGWIGVDLFFVLSGYLITGILLDTRTAPNYFSSFYGRRVLRIFPLYYFALTTILFLALLAANGWLMQVLPVRADWKLYYLYIDNWWPLRQDVYRPNIIGHFWTLAVEEQFYLAWPMLVFLISRRRLMGLTIALSLTALAIRIYLCWVSDPPSRSVVENTFARMDSLLLGALCACVIREPAILARVQAALLPIFGLGIVGAVATNALSSWTMLFTVGFSLLAVAFSGLILHVAHVRSPANELQRFLSAPVLRALGKYSYGIYVYHVPLVMFSAALLPGLGLAGNAAFGFALTGLIVATSFLVARVSYDLLESPFLRLKRYFEPEPAIAMENR